MTQMRSECHANPNFRGTFLSDRLQALKAIARAVNRRRTLIRGALDGEDGKHCAIGCFFADHPQWALGCDLIDEVAAVNDALSDRARQRTRWLRVKRWLRQQIEYLE
jgi:hypothetical protein